MSKRQSRAVQHIADVPYRHAKQVVETRDVSTIPCRHTAAVVAAMMDGQPGPAIMCAVARNVGVEPKFHWGQVTIDVAGHVACDDDDGVTFIDGDGQSVHVSYDIPEGIVDVIAVAKRVTSCVESFRQNAAQVA